ncbi:MAG: hypothetical protein AB1679_17345 [Actinomycetota bacterium]|jgi:hypothetical protein
MEYINLNQDETHALLQCLIRAHDLARSTDNLDVVAMAEAGMDMLIDKWERKSDD